jgi:two-component system NtrC family sensor kinase
MPDQSRENGAADIVAAAVARFTGRLISLFSHELNNHLATLREFTGLADDLLEARLSDKARLREIGQVTRSLDQRIQQASSLVRAFAGIGRRAEPAAGCVDVAACVEELHLLLTKIARQKGITLRTDFSRAAGPCRGDPFLLQCLVFGLFEDFCSRLPHGAEVRISGEMSPSAVQVSILSAVAAGPQAHPAPWDEGMLEAVAGRIPAETANAEGGKGVVITLYR